MPTFFSPGGRRLAGGDRLPVVMPCPHAAAVRARVSITVRIGLELCFALGTVVPLLRWPGGGFPLLCRGCGRGSSLRPGRQSAFSNQVHGAIDGNADDAGVLVHPAIAVQPLFFAQAEPPDLAALVGLEARL